MNNQLFNKALCFSDLHLGLRHNSEEHNIDCVEYIEWFVQVAKDRNAETCIFLGDFMHHRNTINSQTLDYGINVIKLLNDNFKKTYFLVGNHDMYFRDSRNITSTKFATLFPNVALIDNILLKDDVLFIPWLVDDEWKKVSKLKSKYVFGHLEIPGFKMNAMVELPDTGELNKDHLQHQSHVFSGHFHKRQTKGNITYIGNPFGHNYSDVWDFDRGAMFLEWDKDPVFINYEQGPRFISTTLSALLDNTELYLKPKTYLQVTLDTDITYEDACFLRENFLSTYKVREFKLIKKQEDSTIVALSKDIELKSIDQIIIESLNSMESDMIDLSMVVNIYNGL